MIASNVVWKSCYFCCSKSRQICICNVRSSSYGDVDWFDNFKILNYNGPLCEVLLRIFIMKSYSFLGLWLRHPVTRHVHLTTVCRHNRRLVDTIPYVRKLWCQFLWTFNSKYLIIIHQFFNAWKHVLYAVGPAKYKTFVRGEFVWKL